MKKNVDFPKYVWFNKFVKNSLLFFHKIFTQIRLFFTNSFLYNYLTMSVAR